MKDRMVDLKLLKKNGVNKLSQDLHNNDDDVYY